MPDSLLSLACHSCPCQSPRARPCCSDAKFLCPVALPFSLLMSKPQRHVACSSRGVLAMSPTLNFLSLDLFWAIPCNPQPRFPLLPSSLHFYIVVFLVFLNCFGTQGLTHATLSLSSSLALCLFLLGERVLPSYPGWSPAHLSSGRPGTSTQSPEWLGWFWVSKPGCGLRSSTLVVVNSWHMIMSAFAS